MLLAIILATIIGGISANHDSTECSYRKLGLVEGNITLGFMFSFFDSYDETSTICNETYIPNPDNIQLLEAAIFALKQAEGRIPGLIIGLEAYDSCYSGAVAVERSVSFLQDRIIGQGENNTVQGCGEKVKPGLIISLDDGLGGVVGPLMSNALVATTGYAASLLEQSATNGLDYITRTIPSHVEEIRVMTDLMNLINVTYVFLISSNGEESSLRASLFLETAAQNKICVSQHYRLSVTETGTFEIDEIYNQLQLSPVTSVVVVSEDDITREFLMGIDRHTNNIFSNQFFIPYKLLLSLPDEYPTFSLVTVFSALPESLDTSHEDEFDTYFKGLSPSNYNEHADPWFRYFWEFRYSCSFNGSEGSACNEASIMEHMSSYQRNPFVTPVIDAVDAHIQALADVLACNGSDCEPLPAFTQEYYLEKLKIVDITSQLGTNRRVAFKPSGDPEESTFLVMAYTLGSFTKRVVTRWRNGVFDPLDNSIPYVPSRCAEPCLDPMCFPLREVQEQLVAYVEGDVILAGFFPVNDWDGESSECGSLSPNGALYVEAMLYAIQTINKDSTILPFISLGMDGFNTCNSPQRANDIALDLLAMGSFDMSHTATRVSSGGTRLEHFFGIVGPHTLEEITVVNKVVSSNKVPMMGYDIDDPTINSFTFPYFGRVSPSSVTFIQPLLRYMSEQKIFLFQLLYVDDGSFGIRTTLSYFGAGAWVNVCLAQSITIPESDDVNEWNAMFETMTKKPDARAVFILAPSKTIKKVLFNMESRNLAGQYVILAGPSWDLTDEDIQDLNVARGAVIIQSPRRNYTGFKEHVSTLSPTNHTQNPWFADYWMNTFNCSLTGGGTLPNCTGQENLALGQMDDPIIPQIIDATYALAETFHELQLQECNSIDQKVCPGLLEVDGQTFMEILRDRTQFNSNNDGLPVSFDFQLNVDYSYNVVNVQNGRMVQIGTLKNFQVTPATGQTLKFYDEQGNEINLSKFVIGCTTDSCQKSCQRADTDAVAESSIDGTGDVWIGGFFEITEPSSDRLQCSDRLILENIQLLEAFLFAIDQINLNQNLLPDLKLSGIAFDSCGSSHRITKEAGNLVVGTVDYRARYATEQLTVFGAIGGATSDTTDALSTILSAQGINQISYAATATQFSDPSRYPFLLRTVPSDLNQAQVFVDILAVFDWRYVSVVFSDDIYGNDLASIFRDRIANSDICIAMTLAVDRSFQEISFDSLVSALQSNPSSRVVLLFTSEVDTKSVLGAAQRQNITDIQWVGSDTWGRSNFVVENASTASLGAITVSFRNHEVKSFETYFTQLNAYFNTRNPWFRRYFQDYMGCDLFGQPMVYGRFCDFFATIPNEAVDNPLVSSVINAVYAYAYGLDKALKEVCPNVTNHHICPDLENQPEALHAIIEGLNFPSPQDPSVNFTFDENGDSEGRYDILNFMNGADSFRYIKVGSWDKGNMALNKTITTLGRGGTDSPTSCSGRCSECRPAEVAFASLEGFIQIAGLAQVHEAGNHVEECGSLRISGVFDVEAFLFAINVINNDEDILPGIRLGAKIFDSCQSGVKSIRDLSSFYSGTGVFSNDTTWQYMSGVVGGATPIVTELSYQVVRQYKHPQISYSLTSDLDDEYYLIKTTPTVEALIKAVHDLLEYFEWTFVSVIADADDEAQMILYNAFLEISASLCVDTSSTFEADNMDNIISSLGDARIVVMFAGAQVINSMTKATSNHKTFVFPGVTTTDSLEASEAIAGSLVVSFSESASRFESVLSLLNPIKPSDNPWLQEYLGHTRRCNVGTITQYTQECTESDTLGSFRAQDTVNARQIINGVLALATSLHNVQQEKCGDQNKGLCPDFLATDAKVFLDAVANLTIKNENEDRAIFQNGQQLLNITVWNIGSSLENNPVKLADWNGSLPSLLATPQFLDENSNPVQTVKSSCPIASTPSMSDVTDKMTDTPGGGTDTSGGETDTPGGGTDTPSGETDSPGTMTATLCAAPTDQQSKPGGPNGATGFQVNEDYHKKPWFILALVVSGLGVLFTLLAAIVYFLNSDTNYAQLHADFLIYMLLAATLLMFLQTVPFGLNVSSLVCALRRILPGASFSIAFICIFLMVGRYFRILKKEQRISGLGAKYVDNQSQIIAFLPFVAIESIILLQWLLYKLPGFVHPSETMDMVLHCRYIDETFPVSFIFIYLLMLCSILISLLALRRSKVYFTSELRSTIVCCVLSLILGVVWIVCGFVTKVDVYVPATCFLGIIQGYLILVTIFPMIIKKLFRDEEYLMDTNSISDASSVVDGNAGFRNPVSDFESTYDEAPTSKGKLTLDESEM